MMQSRIHRLGDKGTDNVYGVTECLNLQENTWVVVDTDTNTVHTNR
jgi:hypothetical protein